MTIIFNENDDTRRRVLDILKAPMEIQRLKYWMNQIPKSYEERGIYEDDDKLCLFNKEYIVNFGTKIYRKPGRVKGLTFDKTTKKLKLWYGTSIGDITAGVTELNTFLRHCRIEWIQNENLDKWLTKGLLEKILNGKITNPTDASKYIIQSLRLSKGTSPELLRRYIKDKGNKKELYTYSRVLKDLNGYLENPYVRVKDVNWADIVQQANALGKKLDFSWSAKRFAEEHTKMTEELMALEIEGMKDVSYDYPHQPTLPKEFTLIESRKQLFREGKRMSHCVYTNYKEYIEAYQYMVYHVEAEDMKPATVGIILRRAPLVPLVHPQKQKDQCIAFIDQISGIRNSDSYTPEERKKLENFVRAYIGILELRELALNYKEDNKVWDKNDLDLAF